MNRRKFVQIVGLGFVATLASNILAACGGAGGGGADGGTSSESDWTSFTVSGSGKTYKVEIDFYHFHAPIPDPITNQGTGDLTVSTLSSTTAQLSRSIQGTSGHEHRVDLSVDNLDKINNTNVGGSNGSATGFQTVEVVCTEVAQHTHKVRITRTA